MELPPAVRPLGGRLRGGAHAPPPPLAARHAALAGGSARVLLCGAAADGSRLFRHLPGERLPLLLRGVAGDHADLGLQREADPGPRAGGQPGRRPHPAGGGVRPQAGQVQPVAGPQGPGGAAGRRAEAGGGRRDRGLRGGGLLRQPRRHLPRPAPQPGDRAAAVQPQGPPPGPLLPQEAAAGQGPAARGTSATRASAPRSSRRRAAPASPSGCAVSPTAAWPRRWSPGGARR